MGCMPRDVLTNAELYVEFTDRVLGRLPRSESWLSEVSFLHTP